MIDPSFRKLFNLFKYELQISIPIELSPLRMVDNHQIFEIKSNNTNMLYHFIVRVIQDNLIDIHALYDILVYHAEDLGLRSITDNTMVHLRTKTEFYYSGTGTNDKIVAYRINDQFRKRTAYNLRNLESYNIRRVISLYDSFGRDNLF